MDRVDARATKSFSPRKKLIYLRNDLRCKKLAGFLLYSNYAVASRVSFFSGCSWGLAANFCEGSALLENFESRRKDLFYGPVSCERSTGSVNYTRNIPVKKQLEPRLPLLPPSWNKVRDLGSNGNPGIES